MTKLWIAGDHAAFELKEQIIKRMHERVSFEDLGSVSAESVNYPDYANLLCQKVLANSNKDELLNPRGILICGSGVGMSIAANRHPGIRAVLAFSSDVAEISRRHNATNVLCLGARFIDLTSAIQVIGVWVSTPFEGGRHQLRIEMIDSKNERKI